jgi:hypothetical protein
MIDDPRFLALHAGSSVFSARSPATIPTGRSFPVPQISAGADGGVDVGDEGNAARTAQQVVGNAIAAETPAQSTLAAINFT